ncbi:MAG: hypothetical protein CME64_12910 [Halobacteriovoraceae bacterium]|nr:hypothetical protein [Halobacteriovoraceae bacterium]|tara:strand:- start:112397 stop:112837 length:441 start_codon:yes stop_codon:yes gene_type:complete
MKTFFGSMLLTLTFAFAGSGNGYIEGIKKMTLQELSQEEGIELDGDRLWFGLTQVSVVDVCMADEETFRTIEKRTIEVLDEDYFEVVGYDYLYKSIYGTKTFVDGDGTIDVDVVYPTTFEIQVLTEDYEFGNEFLFERSYTVPACE